MFTELFLAGLSRPIAVIGNGRFHFRFGEVIDRYATVIRINAFQIDGYEQWCGSRVTHWCTFGDTTVNPPLPRRRRNGLRPLSPFTSIAPESTNIKPHFRGRMIFAARCRLRHLFPRPSTGFALLLLLQELGYQVDVFGFDGFTSGHYYDPGHRHDANHTPYELEYLRLVPAFRLFARSPRSLGR
ncbi:MAG: hypothetical protein JO328_16340 [Hyphomicrobiales bacterium]|nr:hypothetical protein [Hyphomicrobiales bacterium]MBV8823451.1 hypothetical protein [Hyphomicrobiales bacterium]